MAQAFVVAFCLSQRIDKKMNMTRFASAALMLLMIAGPLFATTRKDTYDMTCNTLWPAVKGTVRNSGDYAVVFIDNDEMIASFAIGAGQGLRIGSAVLNPKGDTCEMQVQVHEQAFMDDTGSFKKCVDATLAASPSSKQPPPSKTGTSDK
jgi:hypothetical protein